MRNLGDCRLYGILDLSYIDILDAPRVAKSMIDGDVDLIQLRGKRQPLGQLADLAGQLHEITSPFSVPLVVNDYAEIAKHVTVEGVHVGQDDDAVAVVRQKVGRPVVVGKSTHSFEQAIAAQREGADYIGFGPIFATPTKPDYKPIGLKDIKRVHVDVSLLIFCIGGIKIDNLAEVIAAGARRVAIVSGLLKAPDIAGYARACKNLLSSKPEP
ncbi:MAG TPA: thiamine phosphate synthase [Chthoniobacterales bacterium]|nr:thiamine phosphate synthase [Chthoniobacterales bacterium]